MAPLAQNLERRKGNKFPPRKIPINDYEGNLLDTVEVVPLKVNLTSAAVRVIGKLSDLIDYIGNESSHPSDPQSEKAAGDSSVSGSSPTGWASFARLSPGLSDWIDEDLLPLLDKHTDIDIGDYPWQVLLQTFIEWVNLSMAQEEIFRPLVEAIEKLGKRMKLIAPSTNCWTLLSMRWSELVTTAEKSGVNGISRMSGTGVPSPSGGNSESEHLQPSNSDPL